jgi:regulatory LuxR family protein
VGLKKNVRTDHYVVFIPAKEIIRSCRKIATAKVHRGQLMRKMGADSLADLVRMAEKIGIPTTKPWPAT